MLAKTAAARGGQELPGGVGRAGARVSADLRTALGAERAQSLALYEIVHPPTEYQALTRTDDLRLSFSP